MPINIGYSPFLKLILSYVVVSCCGEGILYRTCKRQKSTHWLITSYDEPQDPKDEIVYGSSNSLEKHCETFPLRGGL